MQDAIFLSGCVMDGVDRLGGWLMKGENAEVLPQFAPLPFSLAQGFF
jgi:hypothetical protein